MGGGKLALKHIVFKRERERVCVCVLILYFGRCVTGQPQRGKALTTVRPAPSSIGLKRR